MIAWGNCTADLCVHVVWCERIGRAGRPGFDESGVAVVMTSKEHQHLYEEMLQGKENVESNLQSVLVEGTSHCAKFLWQMKLLIVLCH